jgi:hypothetical protein
VLRIERWTEFDRGGHFPGMEQPDLLIGDLRAAPPVPLTARRSTEWIPGPVHLWSAG